MALKSDRSTSKSTGDMQTSPAAEAVDLRKTYGRGQAVVSALDGVNVTFERGWFTAVMGTSGSGKSTLMHCMAGLDRPTSGRSFIGDLDIGTLDDAKLTELRRDRMGFVFQSFNLVPTLTAEETLSPHGRHFEGQLAHRYAYLVGNNYFRTHFTNEQPAAVLLRAKAGIGTDNRVKAALSGYPNVKVQTPRPVRASRGQ